MRTFRFALLGLLAAGAMGCNDLLNVPNENSADRARALARPGDVEALIGASYRQIFAATLGQNGDMLQVQAQVMAMENFGGSANFGFPQRANLPRLQMDNSRNNAVNLGNYNDFQVLHRAARQAAVGLSSVNNPAFTFFPTSASQVARAKAMAHFVIGAALGYESMMYDQGTIIGPNDNASDPTPLPMVPYDSVNRYAMRELDSALTYATPATTAAAFPLPGSGNWFGNPGIAMTQAQFIGLVKGYKAKIASGVARNAADRAAVNWVQIILDAQAFAAAWPTDFVLTMSTTNGWDAAWYSNQSQASNANQWQEQWQFMIGMADTTTTDSVTATGRFPGCATQPYVCWLNTSYATKAPFLIRTPDRRFPAGATRAVQQAVGQGQACGTPMPAGVYIRNRSAPDWGGDPLAFSFYDNEKWAALFCAPSRNGPFIMIATAELNLLAAEGMIRAGNFAGAATLIDLTRVARGGLPPLAGMAIVSAAQLIGPDAVHCVPHTPLIAANRSAGTVTCGTIMEAMKWEKRLEAGWTGPYVGFTDARGWQDLPAGTPIQWMVPYQEIDSRQTFPNAPAYPVGYGGGGAGAAPVGTYGVQ
jgi:hypothetical protein